jgi:ApaG protein
VSYRSGFHRISKARPDVQRHYPSDRSHRRTELHAGTLVGRKTSVFLVLHHFIINSGQETVQLKTRHWIITDASGRKQEVRGEGVIGEQPVLAPGERYEYTSFVPLPTASGFMTGSYQMVTGSGEPFEIEVPTFSLDSPDNKRVLN